MQNTIAVLHKSVNLLVSPIWRRRARVAKETVETYCVTVADLERLSFKVQEEQKAVKPTD